MKTSFSPARRAKIIQAVTRGGQYSGKLSKHKFALYRGPKGPEEIHLLILVEQRWRLLHASMIWTALELIETIAASDRKEKLP